MSPLVSLARLASDCPSARTVARADRARIRKEGSWTSLALAICVGIDVSKDRLDVHLRPSDEAFAVARDGKGLGNLVERLRALDVSLIVLEATGGFETTVAAALAGAGLPLAVVNPRQIRDFARALGKLAKTDAIDAKVIALFAEKIRPEARPIGSEEAQVLASSSPGDGKSSK